MFVGFFGGNTGTWKVERMETIVGPPFLAPVSRLMVIESAGWPTFGESKWVLRGVSSCEWYTTRAEHDKLVSLQPSLGREEASGAALIPIRKSTEWWNLTVDERREVFEERSHHVAMGLNFLPAIARRLLHSRDLGEPFDFLTWFEFPPESEHLFEELLEKLRKSEEWTFVDREVEIRLRLQP